MWAKGAMHGAMGALQAIICYLGSSLVKSTLPPSHVTFILGNEFELQQ